MQEAGWTFDTPEFTHSDGAFEVVLDADGHLKLAGRALTVKIAPELDRKAFDALLTRLRLRLRRELGFAPNTFLLEVEEGSALKAAQALNDLSEVIYAEPSLVEADSVPLTGGLSRTCSALKISRVAVAVPNKPW